MASTKYPLHAFNFPLASTRPRLAACLNQIWVNWRLSSRLPVPNPSDARRTYDDLASVSLDARLIDFDFVADLRSMHRLGIEACLFYQGFSAPIVSTFARIGYSGEDAYSIIGRVAPRLSLGGSASHTPPVSQIFLTFALTIVPVRTGSPAETKVWDNPAGIEDYLFHVADTYGVPKK